MQSISTVYILDSCVIVNINPNAPAKSQADVLLGPVSKFCCPEDVLPRYPIQQEQHSATG